MSRRFFIVVCLLAFASGQCLPQFRETGTGAIDVPAAALQIEETQETKSVLLAIGLSLVLPGMGELYAENFASGRYQLAADGALWLAYAGFVLHSDWIRDDARIFASQHAGADFRGKDDSFDVDVGNFATVDEYNQVRLRNREYDRIYSTADFTWSWDSEESRLRFRRQRIRSDEMFQNSRFVIGALVINRVVSAFIAGRSAGRYNKDVIDRWRLKAQIDGGLFDGNGMKLVLTREF